MTTNKIPSILLKDPPPESDTDNVLVDTSNDLSLFKNNDFSWSDLIELKKEMDSAVIKFVNEINLVLNSDEVAHVVVNLSESQRSNFFKVAQVFFKDMDTFTEKVYKVYETHSQFTGQISSLEEFDIYNKAAIEYQALFTELNALLVPTIAQLMSFIYQNETDSAQAKTDASIPQSEVDTNV